ncbi:MAG TPA: histidinol-phosphatase, partial [Steroidobacteraceae bacterium]|nr:histidinol-phosphatase [Steroidobacteraceae bacterium]
MNATPDPAPVPMLFVDRDGTLIEEPHDEQVDRLDKVRLMPGVFAALQTLKAAGYRLIMVTNQDGIGSERFPREHFELAHDFVLDLFRSQGIEFDAIFVCPHFAHEQCECRKPRTGLVTGYLQQHTLDPERSAMIGDRDTDLEFARALGIRGLRVGGKAPEQSWPAIVSTLLARRASVARRTRETEINLQVELDSDAPSHIAT